MDFKHEQWQTWSLLMVKIQKGDNEAYALLLSELSPLIFNFVRKRVFDPAQVDDVYQEVLLKFHRARHTYQTDRHFGPWLFTVLRTTLWGAIQKNRRFKENEITLESLPDIPSLVKEEAGLDDRLQKALESLPKDNRVAVEMLKLRGMNVETTAKELGITKVALKVRAHRGYKQLRKMLLSNEAGK